MRTFDVIRCFKYFLDAYINEYKLSVSSLSPENQAELLKEINHDLEVKGFSGSEIKELTDCFELQTGITGLPSNDNTFYKFIAYGMKLTDDRVIDDDGVTVLAKQQGFSLPHGLAHKVSEQFEHLTI